jgi:hypothetical protein
MTLIEKKTLVTIQAKHLRQMEIYLLQYLDLLCDQAKEGEKVKEINELAFLHLVINTVLETHCDDTA